MVKKMENGPRGKVMERRIKKVLTRMGKGLGNGQFGGIMERS